MNLVMENIARQSPPGINITPLEFVDDVLIIVEQEDPFNRKAITRDQLGDIID
jgi:hypothetical protein